MTTINLNSNNEVSQRNTPVTLFSAKRLQWNTSRRYK